MLKHPALALLVVSAPLLGLTAPQDTNPRYVLVRESSRSKIEAQLNEAGARGFAWVAGDSQLGDVLLTLRREENTTHTYKVLKTPSVAVPQLMKQLATAGLEGFKVVPNGILQQSSKALTIVLEREPSGTPVVYTSLRVDDHNEKTDRAINGARRQGSGVAGFMRRGSDFEVVMEGAGQAATDDRRYRIISVKRYSTMEEELIEAGNEGFKLVHCSTVSVMVERPTGDAPRHEYRMVATQTSGTASGELDELGSQGFRVVGIPAGQNEFAFVLERIAGAKERYGYRFEKLESEEKFDAQASAAERDGFRLFRVVERFVLFERTLG